ncbi:hypothetical protein GCM10011571_19150 [Marinithermofilum abyssi]|uniref:YokE-like PH domain-containing protein n=1 Tax=Marinithermofilum abyssi TaxID=1571185 RepID=A0A8J2VDS1_9BACL|nr:PH domain-containing protein [Marinithermofilum abyssi]GGE17606.1 hypothetical protein GCM10011571_19150 [Marinithermofilum abyssi]
MVSKTEVRQQIEELNLNRVGRVLGRREINELPRILLEHEHIEGLVYGRYRNRHGVVVATDQRLIFLEKGLISLFVESFDYNQITSLRFETGLLFGAVEIISIGSEGRISGVDKTQILPFVEKIRRHLKQKVEEVKQGSGDSDDYLDELERLARLKEQGILTHDELNEQKKRILKEKKAV